MHIMFDGYFSDIDTCFFYIRQCVLYKQKVEKKLPLVVGFYCWGF